MAGFAEHSVVMDPPTEISSRILPGLTSRRRWTAYRRATSQHGPSGAIYKDNRRSRSDHVTHRIRFRSAGQIDRFPSPRGCAGNAAQKEQAIGCEPPHVWYWSLYTPTPPACRQHISSTQQEHQASKTRKDGRRSCQAAKNRPVTSTPISCCCCHDCAFAHYPLPTIPSAPTTWCSRPYCGLWSGRRSFRPGTNFPGWLFRIQRNEFISGLRHERPTVSLTTPLSARCRTRNDRRAA